MTHIIGDSPALRRFPAASSALIRPRIGAEGAFLVIVLLLGARAFLDLLKDFPNEGLIQQYLWAVVYLVVVVLTLRRIGFGSFVYSFRWFPGICIVLLLAVMSTAWSVAPATTILRSISLVGSTLVGIYIGLRIPPRAQMRIYSWCFATLILLSVISAVAFPSYGTMIYSNEFFINVDAWKGISPHKNSLGPIAAICTIFFLVRLMTGDMGRFVGTAMVCLSFLTVVKSDSMISLGMVMTGIAMLVFCVLSSRLRLPRSAITILGIIILLNLAGFSILGWEWFLEIVGRDTTVTGRIFIWADALRLIRERPLLGFGFDAVWGFDSESLFPFYLTVPKKPHAHNGFLGVAVELGIPAGLLSLGLLLTMVRQSVLDTRTQLSAYSLYAASFMFMFLIYNVIETGLFIQQEFIWINFVSLSVAPIVHKQMYRLETTATADDRWR